LPGSWTLGYKRRLRAMATSRTRSAASARRPPSLTRLRARDAVATWLVPGVAAVIGLVAAALGATEVVARAPALATLIGAALVIVLFIGLQPLLGAGVAGHTRVLGAGVALAWLTVAYLPFHLRLFPGTPVLPPTEITAAGGALPVRIPAAGHPIELVLEGRLGTPPDGSVAPPVHYALTLVDAAGGTHSFVGTFEDTLRSRRLGRRGSATVHQVHSAERHVVRNRGGGDLTVTGVVLEPATAAPLTVAAYPHRLPGPIGLAIAAIAFLAAVVAYDAVGPSPSTDGALTLGTAAVLGCALIFWTSDAVHPDFQTLIGATIFGGPLGFAAGAACWWVAKRVLARSA
jgi:hypothetical protein